MALSSISAYVANMRRPYPDIRKGSTRALRRETFRGPSEDYGLATDALRLLELRKK